MSLSERLHQKIAADLSRQIQERLPPPKEP